MASSVRWLASRHRRPASTPRHSLILQSQSARFASQVCNMLQCLTVHERNVSKRLKGNRFLQFAVKAQLAPEIWCWPKPSTSGDCWCHVGAWSWCATCYRACRGILPCTSSPGQVANNFKNSIKDHKKYCQNMSKCTELDRPFCAISSWVSHASSWRCRRVVSECPSRQCMIRVDKMQSKQFFHMLSQATSHSWSSPARNGEQLVWSR